ncbi:MAG TPA: PhoU domain-containing protein [Trebonia sp.]|nr:PhoU domain-containing protein [Trebonia sp.]
MNGTRTAFGQAMEAIEAKVSELFGMLAEDLPAATDALLGACDLVAVVAEREKVIDTLYQEVEELAGRQILLQAPVGPDLRFLLAVLRVTPELERSHDLVMQIASQASRLPAEDLSSQGSDLAGQMGRLAARMWHQAAYAWYARDPASAATLSQDDQEMDGLYARLTAELTSGRMTLPVAMEMTLVARCYERLAAHAVNIARRVTTLAGPVASYPSADAAL